MRRRPQRGERNHRGQRRYAPARTARADQRHRLRANGNRPLRCNGDQ